MPGDEGYTGSEGQEKQCRICLDGPDPELGRLIKPCLCRGSMRYVHIKCLQRWRNTSHSSSAFYACDQCHYKYAFARTRALGLASNPIFVGMLSAFIFTLLLYFASFIATFLFDPSDTTPSRSFGFGFFGFYYVSPWDIASDLIKIALRVLTDDDMPVNYNLRRAPLGHTMARPNATSTTWFGDTILGRFFRRVFLGIPVVGAVSLMQVLSTTLLTPIHFLSRRGLGGSRRGRVRDIGTILVLIALIAGAARALWKIYRLTENVAKRILLRAEDVILEVN